MSVLTGERLGQEEPPHGGVDRGPLNLILYGPPGTGKTYSVQREAIRILRPEMSELLDDEVGKLYRRYRAEGRIEFVTFHPSYSYEAFATTRRRASRYSTTACSSFWSTGPRSRAIYRTSW